MTPEEAIEILKEDVLVQVCMIEHDSEFDREIFNCDASCNISKKKALDMAIESIKEVQKYREIGTAGANWIPVEESLPPEPQEYVDDEDDLKEYIVMIEGAERPTTLRYAGDGNWWEDGTYYPVTAWQPFPKPYHPADKTEKPDWRKDMLRKFDRRE